MSDIANNDDGFVMSRKLEIMALNKSVLVLVLEDT